MTSYQQVEIDLKRKIMAIMLRIFGTFNGDSLRPQRFQTLIITLFDDNWISK